MKYRDAELTWAEIVRSFAISDKKTKGKVETMGQIIFLACDSESKDNLRGAEMEGIFKISGMDGD